MDADASGDDESADDESADDALVVDESVDEGVCIVDEVMFRLWSGVE